MANILYRNGAFVIGFKTTIYFIDITNCAIKKRLIIPQISLQPILNEDDEDTDKKSVNKIYVPFIQHMDVSLNGEYLAVALSGQKLLLLYRILEEEFKLLSTRHLSRTSSALSFSSDSKNILLCDKTGDCYVFDCCDFNRQGKWILGHLSIVMDASFSMDERFIITCDRDEKIRVTKYPDTYEIECYCLGHLEYVSSIQILPLSPQDTYLLSLSGDKTMKIWEYKIGLKVGEVKIPAPGVKFCLRSIDESTCHVALLLYQPLENVIIYKISLKNSNFESEQIRKFCFNPGIVTNLCYGESKLYLTLVKNNRLHIEVVQENSVAVATGENANLKNFVNNLFENDEYTQLDDISLWFKKKFDNVSDYLERKKRRIEEKCSR